MAFAYITEYRQQALDNMNFILPAGREPSLAVQRVAIGVGSVQSAPFNANTTFVAINVDVACSIAFGANPTATALLTRLPADGTQYFGVNPGDRVAVITNT